MIYENRFSLRKLVITGILGGVSIALGLTPLGFIPVGPTKATIMHIPVIIGAIMEGPLVGGLVGFIFGLFSMIQAITNPTPVSFVFLNPIVSILPRILIGIVSYYSYELFKKMGEKLSTRLICSLWGLAILYLTKVFIGNITGGPGIGRLIFDGIFILLTLFAGIYIYKTIKLKAGEIVVSAISGTLTNTIGVLLSIYLLHGQKYVEVMGLNPDTAGKVILGIGITHGIPEIIIAVIIVTSVIAALSEKNKLR